MRRCCHPLTPRLCRNSTVIASDRRECGDLTRQLYGQQEIATSLRSSQRRFPVFFTVRNHNYDTASPLRVTRNRVSFMSIIVLALGSSCC